MSVEFDDTAGLAIIRVYNPDRWVVLAGQPAGSLDPRTTDEFIALLNRARVYMDHGAPSFASLRQALKYVAGVVGPDCDRRIRVMTHTRLRAGAGWIWRWRTRKLD